MTIDEAIKHCEEVEESKNDNRKEDMKMSKGIYIPGITSEQFINADLSSIEDLMSSGDILDTEPNGWMKWIPAESEVFPDVDDDGMSKYILLSFENFSGLLIGHYTEDEDGGMFHIGDCVQPAHESGLIVSAWMPLPEPYKQESENET